MQLQRGDIVTAAPDDYGKPRPALVIQSDLFNLASTTILPLTSELHETPALRINVEAGPATGLQVQSQIMIDKITTISRRRVGQRIGRIDEDTMLRIEQALAVFLGLG